MRTMVSSLPPGGPRQRPTGNRAYALIFLVTVVLLVSLYTWNKQKVDAANQQEEARDRLCEVRRETNADLADCPEEN
jgi:uncharacterized membrane protein